jgi:hypothetical protein
MVGSIVGANVFDLKAENTVFVGFLVRLVGPVYVGLWVGLFPLGDSVGIKLDNLLGVGL